MAITKLTADSITSGAIASTPAFQAYRSATVTISDDTFTKVQFDTEVYDTDSCYDNSTNYRFTPTVAGKYFVHFSLIAESDTARRIEYANFTIYKNGSEEIRVTPVYSADNISWQATGVIGKVIEMNGTTDYLEMYLRCNVFSGSPKYLGNDSKYSSFGAYRIGD
jgi:hypothetical protein